MALIMVFDFFFFKKKETAKKSCSILFGRADRFSEELIGKENNASFNTVSTNYIEYNLDFISSY